MLDEEEPAVHVVRVLGDLGLGRGDAVGVDGHDDWWVTGVRRWLTDISSLPEFTGSPSSSDDESCGASMRFD